MSTVPLSDSIVNSAIIWQ